MRGSEEYDEARPVARNVLNPCASALPFDYLTGNQVVHRAVEQIPVAARDLRLEQLVELAGTVDDETLRHQQL